MKRILFVDDEASILDALRNLLRKQRHEWDMVFALGSPEALVELGKAPFDVVVTDMRMPGMDGAALLEHVRDAFPGTARIVLSGHADNDAVVRALPVTHQFLSKPCDASTLRGVIERTCGLQKLLQNEATRAVIGKLDRLPSPPATYHRLNAELGKKDATAASLARVLEEDPAMSAKILQLVNSAYFGLAHRVGSVAQAVAYLGLGVLRALALNAHVLGSLEGTTVSRATLDGVQRTSLATATVARRKIRDKKLADEAFTAGVVHDIGKLVVALGMPGTFREIDERARAEGRPPHELEEELLGVSHAEVGAYLLGVWGLPFSIVECTALHHVPSRAGTEPGELLLAVHLAAAAVEETSGSGAQTTLDRELLTKLGRTGEIEGYREAAAAHFERLNTGAADHVAAR
ncbi:MAG TPA: response regulator [Polyangiaceae bacterium]|jgi:HD-like signal output (HDOD) protein|nr:response regulator [Polyangiaceae bacterium]